MITKEHEQEIKIREMVEKEGLLPERVATLLNIPLEMVYNTLYEEDLDDQWFYEQYDEDIQ